MESVNVRLKDLRYLNGEAKLTQKDVADKLGIAATSIADYEKEGHYVPSNVLIKYCNAFHVSADYLLGLTNTLKQPHYEIHELGLTDGALDKLRSEEVDSALLSEIIEHKNFDNMLLDAAIYVNGFVDESIQKFNDTVQIERIKQEGADIKSREVQKKLLEADYVRMDQDYLFSGRMANALLSILRDIKFNHKNDSSTSDYQDGYSDQKALMKIIFDEYNKEKEKMSFGKLIHKSLLHILGVKISDSELDRVAKSNDPTELGNMMEQSPLIEPDARKRRRKK